MKKFHEKQAGIISSSDLKTKKGQCVYWTMVFVLLIACCLALIPSLWALFTGFKDTKEIYSGLNFFPENLTWQIAKERIITALSAMHFWKTAFNTLILSIGSSISAIIVSGLGGYVISRLKPKGTTIIFMLIVWTMMMPGQIRTVPLFISYLSFPFVAELPGEVSLLNTYWPMWLGAAASCFNIILFKNHFDSISNSLVEAARLDGCGNGKIFFKIMVPLSTPIILYVAIMAMKGAWSNFFTGYLVLSDQNIMTLPVRVYVLKGEPGIKMNIHMLCLVLSCIPMLVLFAIFNKHIVHGVNVGGVKG